MWLSFGFFYRQYPAFQTLVKCHSRCSSHGLWSLSAHVCVCSMIFTYDLCTHLRNTEMTLGTVLCTRVSINPICVCGRAVSQPYTHSFALYLEEEQPLRYVLDQLFSHILREKLYSELELQWGLLANILGQNLNNRHSRESNWLTLYHSQYGSA